jgi:hypothetical protein
MTKGRVVPPSTVVAEQEPFFITLGGPNAHDSSVEKHFQERAAEPQVPPLRFAPVGACDFIDFSRFWRHLRVLFSASVFSKNQ